MAIARSYLYVPGDREEVLARAAGRGADALIIDLEDAVAPASKDRARELVSAFLRDPPVGLALWVRVNPGAEALTDLEAVVAPALAGVCLAKAETAVEVTAVADALGDLERRRDIAPGAIGISALLESAAAVSRINEIATAPRVIRLQLGEADLKADLGVELGPDERELLWVRSRAVLASAAAGIDPPVAPVSIDFRDVDALRESTRALKRLGYRGRACVHPAQVEVVNDVFTPSVEELERARELIEGYEAALAAGSGVFVDATGRMVDLAVVRAARRILELAR
ncbi:HpcH/HpaI aldolase/citrate lyase family protein [Micromonospora carbonacea]|uniref:Citrate lyase subunit beta / citryl-CoA lyase n=1 Tax=Micromonospora carbonacea TaxID=47853 RepID=A0A1C4V7L7_9ACTN|nr:citrate lyase subunit beta / citryl-CoA lyase [Micromonospora carbonacea]